MKVENNGLNRISRQETENAYSVERNPRLNDAAGVDGLSGKDKATLSESARLLAKARASLEDTPEMRTELVNKFRDQIQTGNYQVPHEEIVKRLLAQFRSTTGSA